MLTKIDLIKKLNEYNIKNYGSDEFPLFKANDIAHLLDIAQIRSSIISFTEKEKIKKIIQSNSGMQKSSMLTYDGFYKLLLITKKPTAIELCKIFNVKTIYKYILSETSFVYIIKKIFDGEEIIEQFSVDNYHIDLYFPVYKLAIEFDETYHNYNENNDIIRENIIKKHLNCTFLRIKEKDDIYQFINIIYKYIRNHE